MTSKTKLRANQVNVREIMGHADALATTNRKGTVEFATQAEVLAGSPVGVVVTTDTLKNHPGLDELKDMYVTSGSPSDTLHSDKQLFNLEVNAGTVFTAEEVPDYGYDAASLTYASLTTTFSPPSASNDMESIYIRPDGNYVYIVDRVSSPGIIREFPLSTPWDISSRGTNSANYTMSSGDHVNAMQGIWFNDEGTKAIVSGQSDWAEYSFSTPWDIANATFVQAITDLGESTGSTPLTFSKDGLHAYRTRRAFSANQWYVTEYQLGTAWNLSTISLVSDANEITGDMAFTNNAAGCAINHDGTKLFVAYDNVSDTEILEYSLATPYTVSSRTLTGAVANLTQSRFSAYPFWGPDGTDFYLVNDRIAYQYTSSAVDIGGLTTTLYHDGSERLGTRSTGVDVTGVLELSGSTAQVALPNYTTASLPATNYEGGIVYDSDTTSVKFYSGSPGGWVNVGLQNIVEDATPQLGGNLDVNGYNVQNAAGTSYLTLATGPGGDSIFQSAVGVLINSAGGYGIAITPDSATFTGGVVQLVGGTSTANAGGFAAVNGGNGAAGGGGAQLRGGNATTTGTGGDVLVAGGTSTAAQGGSVNIEAGNGTSQGVIAFKSASSVTTAPTVQFREGTTNGTEFVAFKAPDAITTSRTWTLPVDDPAVIGGGSPLGAQFLTTDASGNLSFAAAAGITAVVEDTTPQLGGNLDTNGQYIVTANTTAAVSPDWITIWSGGASYAGGGINSGQVQIRGGSASNNNNGGRVLIQPGPATGSGNAGNFDLLGSNSVTGTGTSLTLTAGSVTGVGTPGNVSLTAGGALGASGTGGKVTISSGTSANGNGGDLELKGGSAQTAALGGDIEITPGGGASATTGNINIHTGTGIVGQAAIRLWDDTNTGHTTGNYIELKVPAGIGSPTPANWTLTLPPNDGTDGQFLQTDGSGNTAWSTELKEFSETAVSYGTTGAIALNTANGTYFYPTGATTGVITFSFTNPAASGRVTSFTLELWGDAGSPSPYVWPSSVKWPAGTEPSWTASGGSPLVNGYDVVSFVTRDGGTTWLGMLGGLAFA